MGAVFSKERFFAMTKNIFVSALIGFLVAFVTVKVTMPNIYATQGEEEQTVFERVIDRGTIRCGYALWPPHVLAKDPNSGEISGISHDIIEEIAVRTNLKIEWVEETGWGNWVEGINNNRFDVFCSGAWQDSARARDISWTVPYMFSALYLYTRADDTRFDEPDVDLNNENITLSTTDGMMSATVANLFFPKAKQVALPQLTDSGQQLLAVVNGKADAVFEEPSTVKSFAKTNGDVLKIAAGGKPYNIFPTTFGVKMGEYNLLSMLNSTLTEMKNQGVIEKIIRDYEEDPTVFLLPNKPYQSP